jgi:hypothetical protein
MGSHTFPIPARNNAVHHIYGINGSASSACRAATPLSLFLFSVLDRTGRAHSGPYPELRQEPSLDEKPESQYDYQHYKILHAQLLEFIIINLDSYHAMQDA